MQGILRYNEERTAFEAQVDEHQFDLQRWPGNQLALLSSDGVACLAVLEGYEGLKSHTIYQLVPMDTMIKTVEFDQAEIDALPEEDDDDDDDDDDYGDDDDDDDDD